MNTKRKKYLAAYMLFLIFSLNLISLTSFAASPKAAIMSIRRLLWIGAVSGYQLTAQENIRDAIFAKNLMPVELVLKPLYIENSAIRLAHGNSGDFSPLEDYRYFRKALGN